MRTIALQPGHIHEFQWGDAHVNVVSHSADERVRTVRGALCTVMHPHDTAEDNTSLDLPDCTGAAVEVLR